jgi:hypothetical protein
LHLLFLSILDNPSLHIHHQTEGVPYSNLAGSLDVGVLHYK